MNCTLATILLHEHVNGICSKSFVICTHPIDSSNHRILNTFSSQSSSVTVAVSIISMTSFFRSASPMSMMMPIAFVTTTVLLWRYARLNVRRHTIRSRPGRWQTVVYASRRLFMLAVVRRHRRMFWRRPFFDIDSVPRRQTIVPPFSIVVISLVFTPLDASSAFLVTSFVTSLTIAIIRNALSTGVRRPRTAFNVNRTRGVVSTQIWLSLVYGSRTMTWTRPEKQSNQAELKLTQ